MLRVNGGLLRKLKYSRYYNPYNQYINNYQPTSPCPDIFEYRKDNFGQLYGYIKIPNPGDEIIRLQVELSVGNRVEEGKEGELLFDATKQDEISNLYYRMLFPEWQNLAPKVTTVSVNDDLICSGPKLPLNLVSILTTVYLEHTLYNKINDKSDSYETDARKNNKNTSFNSKNPYNFNPGFPRKGNPQIINGNSENNDSVLYPKNPFLSKSDEKPNQFSFNPSATTERMSPTLDQSKENRPRNNRDSMKTEDICGTTVTTNHLILNGAEVPRGAFPWLVALFVAKPAALEYQCAGSLISKRHVITAAHCVRFQSRVLSPEQINLFLGKLNIQKFILTDGEVVTEAEKIYTHPDYVENSANADLAIILIRGDFDLSFTNYIRPICLWKEATDLDLVVGKNGFVVGWGRDENGRKITAEPRQVEMPVVSQEECLRSNISFYDITSEKTFCAGFRNDSGPCNGDSGSGFVMNRNGRWYLKGIVSMSLSEPFKRTCDLKNYVVFTDASKFLDWIKTIVSS